jgi:hypothetical protein
MVFENRVLRKIFGPKRAMHQGSGGDSTVKSFMRGTPHQIFFG